MDSRLILQQLGYTKKEAAVYLATLELGTAPVSVTARRAGLNRATTMSIFQKLSQKGIAEFFLRKKTRYYSVLPPSVLLNRHREYVRQLEGAIPQMAAIHNQLVHKPRITFYEGKEDLKRLYLDILNAKTEILNYFLPEKTFVYFSEEWVMQAVLHERIQRKIPARVIMPDSALARLFLCKAQDELRDARIIGNTTMHFANEMFIYDKKMSVFSFDEDFALLIEGTDIVQTNSIIFELAWKSALLEKSTKEM
ncbi:hypothetical protein HY213_04885 [Candidatus Peregrinibacteria bacterium]|nr:hypothetical protein [Candidatus Peregrinibacteria bacterium]